MTLRIESRRDVGPAAWNGLVERSTNGWLWHSYEYLDALELWPERRDMSFGLIDDTGDLVVIVPLSLSSTRVRKVIELRVLESQGGPAVDGSSGLDLAEATDSIRHQVRRTARKLGAVSARFTFVPPRRFDRAWAQTIEALRDALRLVPSPGWSWVVDLRGGEKMVWDAMEKRARTATRKAQKLGIQVRKAANHSDLDSYYGLHRETYARSKIRPHPREYFESIWEDFLSRGTALALVAEDDQGVIAAQTFAIYKKQAVYWTGCSKDQALSSGVNNLLQWNAMKHMIEQGIVSYETGEAFPAARSGKEKGLSDFKKAMGGNLTEVVRADLPLRHPAALVRRTFNPPLII